MSPDTGRAEVLVDGRTHVLSYHAFGNVEAGVFCRSLEGKGYQFGTMQRRRITGSVDEPVLMDFIDCRGDEANILQCGGNVMPPTPSIVTANTLVYVECSLGGG